MKTQVFVIHGGNSYDTYEDYLAGLARKEVQLEYLHGMNWKKTLGQDLGNAFDVYNPQMPSKENAKYAEWKIWFEKYIPLLADEVVLIGHSLGGIFLAKYLAENAFSKSIRAVFLVAAPYNSPTEHPRADFNILTNLSELERQAKEIYIYHSKDDQVVPFSNFERYMQELPAAHAKVFESRGHFNEEHFPELVADVQNLNG